MAHGDARDGKWRGNWRMEWVASTLHTTSEHGVSCITTADAHTSAASSRLNWRPRRFKWTRPFRRKTKSNFCACAITFQLASTYSEGVFVGLVIQHAVRMRLINCRLSGCTIFFHIISQTARFSSKSCWTQNVCFDFLYNFYLKHFLFWEELSETPSQIYVDLHVKYPLFLSDVTETQIFSTDFLKMLEYQITWKSVRWAPSYMRKTDGQTRLT